MIHKDTLAYNPGGQSAEGVFCPARVCVWQVRGLGDFVSALPRAVGEAGRALVQNPAGPWGPAGFCVKVSWTCRRMEKFCGRFSLAGKEEIRSKTHNMRLYSAKMCTTNLTQTVCLRLCGELFCFSGLTRSFSWTHGSGACPAPASSTAFSGQRPGPAGTAPCGCWPCPRLKNGGIQSRFSADQRRLPPE